MEEVGEGFPSIGALDLAGFFLSDFRLRYCRPYLAQLAARPTRS